MCEVSSECAKPDPKGHAQGRFNMENLTIKVYGSGCKGCQTLHQNVIDALAEMNVAAGFQKGRLLFPVWHFLPFVLLFQLR